MTVSPLRQAERERQAQIIEQFLNSLIAGLESRGFIFNKRPEDIYGDRIFGYDHAYLEMKIVGSFPIHWDVDCSLHVWLNIREHTRSMSHRLVLCHILDQMRKRLEVCRISAWGADEVLKHSPDVVADSIVLVFGEWNSMEPAVREFANQMKHVIMEFTTEQMLEHFGATDAQ